MPRNPEMHFGLGRFHSASDDGLSNNSDGAAYAIELDQIESVQGMLSARDS